MLKNKYNDYELLYLISEHSEIALEIMLEKYRPLIMTRIREFNIKSHGVDDFYQEGLMILHCCINRFSDVYNKTFTKYFDMCLQRRFMDLLRKNYNYFYDTILVDDFWMLREDANGYRDFQEEVEDEIYLEQVTSKLSNFEKIIFELRFVKGYKVKEISQIVNKKTKIIYNALTRMKIKLTEQKKTIDKNN